MSEVWAVAVAAVVSAGAAAYSANQQKKASQQASAAALAGAQSMQPGHVPPPATVSAEKAQLDALRFNNKALKSDFELAGQVNNFQLGQALRGYNRIQPYFQQLQAQLGKNALEMSQGKLPSDVVSSIGRAAAERGFSQGFGQGANGAGASTNLGSLNLRNLGLTSLQTSQSGNQLGLQLNAQAGALAPALFDPSSMFVSPALSMAEQQFNAGAINSVNRANAGFQNDANVLNTSLQNTLLQQQTQNALASSIAQSNAYNSAAQNAAGLLAQYGTTQSGGGGAGASPVAYGYYGGGSGAGGTYGAANSNWQNKYV